VLWLASFFGNTSVNALVGGNKNKGESDIAAALRECHEETGGHLCQTATKDCMLKASFPFEMQWSESEPAFPVTAFALPFHADALAKLNARLENFDQFPRAELGEEWYEVERLAPVKLSELQQAQSSNCKQLDCLMKSNSWAEVLKALDDAKQLNEKNELVSVLPKHILDIVDAPHPPSHVSVVVATEVYNPHIRRDMPIMWLQEIGGDGALGIMNADGKSTNYADVPCGTLVRCLKLPYIRPTLGDPLLGNRAVQILESVAQGAHVENAPAVGAAVAPVVAIKAAVAEPADPVVGPPTVDDVEAHLSSALDAMHVAQAAPEITEAMRQKAHEWRALFKPGFLLPNYGSHGGVQPKDGGSEIAFVRKPCFPLNAPFHRRTLQRTEEKTEVVFLYCEETRDILVRLPEHVTA
jgi:hypothetical protein